MEGME